MIFMVKITDTSGVEHNLNLDYVVSVSLPSGANLNERILLARGAPITVVAGTWETAVAEFFLQFDDNPQPMANIKDKVFIMP